MGENLRRSAVLIAWVLVVGLFIPLATAPAGAAEVELVPMRQIGGSGHAELYGWGLAATGEGDGSVYVGDYWNYSIHQYAKDGTRMRTVVTKFPEGAAPHAPPYGIAVDPRNGDIYFGDVDSDATVDKYDRDGNFLYEFGGIGEGLGFFTYPSRIAVTADGYVIISDSRAEKLSVWDDSGNPVFEREGVLWGEPELSRPRGLALDAGEAVYVADAGLQKVQVFQLNRNTTTGVPESFDFVRSMGIPKAHPGEPLPGELGLDMRGLTLDEANDWLYVVDADTGKVAKFRKSDGQFLTFFGGNGTGDGEFSGGGRDIAIDGDGNVWVGDMPNFRVQKFSPWGQFLQAIPDPPQPPPPGGFSEPRSVGVDQWGNVFVADTHNWRIQKFDAAGDFVTQWGKRGPDADEFNYQRGIAVDWTTGKVAVADTDGNAIKTFDNDGNPQCIIDKHGGLVGEWRGPRSVDWGPDGLVYAADTQNGRIQILEERWIAGGECDLEVRAVNGVIGGKGTGDGQFHATNGIAVDTDGTLWVSDRLLGRVQHLANTGAFLSEFGDGVGTGPTEFEHASDVEVDANYVYVTDAETNRIKIWRKDGTFVREWGSGGNGLGQLQRPHGMDLTPDGRLYVTEQTNERVQEFVVGFDIDPEANAPTVAITDPASNAALPLEPITIGGTAGDDTGVVTAQVAIKNIDLGTWWTGAGWGSFTWLFADVVDPGIGAKNTTWTFDFDPEASGGGAARYGMQARAQDAWGNATTAPWRQFTVFEGVPDEEAPSIQVDVPAGGQGLPMGPLTISGTATDNQGVTSVKLAVKDATTNTWWNGSGWGGWSEVSAMLASPGGTSTAWSYTLTPASVGGYGLSAKAFDAAGNVKPAPWVSFSTFDGASDDIDPETEVGSPAGGSSVPLGSVTLAGTATDNQGVTSVKVAIKDVTANKFWTGSGWGSWTRVEATLTDAGATNTDWSYTFTPPQAGSFTYSPQAGDAAGNLDPTPPWVTFSVYDGAADAEPPDATVTTPSPNQSFPAGLIELTGAATDNQEVAEVELAIKNSTTGQWWTGGGWGGFTYLDATLATPGATSTGWSFTFDPPATGGYGMLVRAQDAAGNHDPSRPWVSFSNG